MKARPAGREEVSDRPAITAEAGAGAVDLGDSGVTSDVCAGVARIEQVMMTDLDNATCFSPKRCSVASTATRADSRRCS